MGYKHMEYAPKGRMTMMPHCYVQKFLDKTHVDYAWLSTGNGRAPAKPQPALKKGRGRKSGNPQKKVANR